MDLISAAGSQVEDISSYPTSKPELLFIGILLVSVMSILLLLLLFSSSRKSRKSESVEREEIADRIERVEPTIKKKQENPEELKALEWMRRRRRYIAGMLAKLQIKKINVGLSPEEEVKRKFYEQELFLLQQELLSNDAFLSELSEKADWALQQAIGGTPSKEIRKKLIDEGYTKKEIAIIRLLFARRKAELKEELGKNANL